VCPTGCVSGTTRTCEICISNEWRPDENQESQTCEDGLDLTQGDICINGTCTGIPTPCHGVQCPACHKCVNGNCTVDDDWDDVWQDGTQVTEACPTCHACYLGNCTIDAADGHRCDDSNNSTNFDTCNNGTCSGQPCVHSCPEGGCDQTNLDSPCCEGGGCDQTNATNPVCAGNCTQVNATDCFCSSPGACDQTGCTDPECPPYNCPGNCLQGMAPPPECQMCVLGEYRANSTMNGEDCDAGEEFVLATCDEGTCVGLPETCFTATGESTCNPVECKKCDVSQGGCVADPEKDGNPCIDHFGTTGECNDGACYPTFTIIDDIVVHFGLQQVKAEEMQAAVDLRGIVQLRFPWQLIDQAEMKVEPADEDFVVCADTACSANGTASMEAKDECTKYQPSGDPKPYAQGDSCTQNWRVQMTVLKVCDVLSVYTFHFKAKRVNVPIADQEYVTARYTVTLAQAAVCGIVIEKVPLTGDIMIIHEDGTQNTKHLFSLESEVWFLMWASGVAPIEKMDLMEMKVELTSTPTTTPGIDGPPYYIYLEPGRQGSIQADPPIPKLHTTQVERLKCCTLEQLNYTYFTPRGAEMKWSIWLSQHTFRIAVSDTIRVSLSQRVTYQQNRRVLADGTLSDDNSLYTYYETNYKMPGADEPKTVGYFYSEKLRRFLQSSEENEYAYQFDTSFTVVPFRCTSEFDQWGVEVGSYMATPCPDGQNMYMRYCGVDGWDDEKSRNTCEDPTVETGDAVVTEEEDSGGMMMIIVLISCAIVLCAICMMIYAKCFMKKKKTKKAAPMPKNNRTYDRLPRQSKGRSTARSGQRLYE